ncbi:MAG: hypothetical protein K6C07_03070 [Bacteroidales bacterium]|nr:hypothetical protein [Bacteroidales bacterium]
MKHAFPLLTVWLAILTACSHPEDKPVVRVYDATLSMADIQWMQADFAKDSEKVEIHPETVSAWVEKQVMVHAAKNALSQREKDFDREIKDYYETLLVDAYETKEVEKRLDRNVTEEEIQEYYQAHKEDFEMHKTIVRINYAKFPLGFPQTETVRALLFKGSGRTNAEQEKLERICYGQAENMYLESNWVVFDDILKEIPLAATNQQQYLQKNKSAEITDSNYIYLVYFADYKINETYSPLENERENIRNRLLEMRRVELLRAIRKNAIEKARKEHEIHYEIKL